MRSEELDKLFKNKLEDISHAPSGNAWSRVETQLSDKKGAWFYMRIAAAVLLLITFAGLYYLNIEPKDITENSLTKNQPTELIQPTPTDTAKIDSSAYKQMEIEPVNPIEDNLAEVTDTTKNKPMHSGNDIKKAVPVQKENLAQNMTKNQRDDGLNKKDTVMNNATLKDLRQNKELVAENSEEGATSTANDASPNQESDSGTTLVFDIEEFDMKTAVTKAYDAAEETKKTGFKKVLDFVKSVKEGETGLGGLREAKNNLLSIKQKDKEDENSK